MRHFSDDPIDELTRGGIAREFFWLCLIIWVLAWLGITALLEWKDTAIGRARAFIRDRRHVNDGLDVRVLDSMRQNQRPNPATRTGTFLHRGAR